MTALQTTLQTTSDYQKTARQLGSDCFNPTVKQDTLDISLGLSKDFLLLQPEKPCLVPTKAFKIVFKWP